MSKDPISGQEYPEPREGITGTDRDDDLLSLEPEAIGRRRLVAGIVSCLRQAVLVGNPAPIVAQMWERMKNPQAGDLVIEDSTIWRRGDDDTLVKAFGVLLGHRTEWCHTDTEWAEKVAQQRADHEDFLRRYPAEAGDEPFRPYERPTDHIWYVQYGTQADAICRWENCGFMAVPTDPREFTRPLGTPSQGGVTVDRNDVAGFLADSGFQLRD